MNAQTAPPAVYGQFGQALGLAEKTLTARLSRRLAERDTSPEAWYALRLIATGGPELDRKSLRLDLEDPRGFDSEAVDELLAGLEADGLIHGEGLDLTDEGRALYHSLREYITGPTVELLEQFDTEDLETTVRTLRAITERAKEESG